MYYIRHIYFYGIFILHRQEICEARDAVMLLAHLKADNIRVLNGDTGNVRVLPGYLSNGFHRIPGSKHQP